MHAEYRGDFAARDRDRLARARPADAQKVLKVGVAPEAFERDLGFVECRVRERSSRAAVQPLIEPALFLPSVMNPRELIDHESAYVAQHAEPSGERVERDPQLVLFERKEPTDDDVHARSQRTLVGLDGLLVLARDSVQHLLAQVLCGHDDVRDRIHEESPARVASE
jgi:hypothetical protein